MRKLLALALMLVSLSACAQTIVYKSQATLKWNAVTVDSTGTPLLATDVIAYEVYIYNYTVGVADAQNVASLISVGTTTALEQLIVFPSRSVWAAGVRVKLTDAGAHISYSSIAWSYIVADADVVAGPFVYSPSGLPGKVKGLKDKGT
jgi:hypothetical protein